MSRLMTRFWLVFLLVCLLSALPCAGQGASPHDYRKTIQGLSQQVHEQLEDLKVQSATLTTQLAIAENDLKLSQGQVSELQTQLKDLNICLENTNRKLAAYSTKLIEYEAKLKGRAKAIAALGGILLLIMVIKAVIAFLYFKGVPLPKWLCILA